MKTILENVNSTELILLFGLSSIIVYTLMPILIKIAFRYKLLCNPNDTFVDVPRLIRKKSHDYSIPVIGGISIYFSLILCFVYLLYVRPEFITSLYERKQLYCILVGSSILFIVGIFDDIYKISYLKRILIQFIVVIGYLWICYDYLIFEIPGIGIIRSNYVGYLILTIWFVVVINSINFIDGLDGLATGIVIISSTFILFFYFQYSTVISIILINILCSCLIFLRFNMFPAKIFLGSSGVFVLGFILGSLGIYIDRINAPIKHLPYVTIILAVPIIDLIIVFAERLLHGLNPCVADSWHIHDRVVNINIGKRKAAYILWSLGLVFALISISYYFHQNIYILLFFLIFVFFCFRLYLYYRPNKWTSKD